MGIQQQTLRPVLTLTLGAIETTPLEMATVASTIASGGVRHGRSSCRRSPRSDGKVLFDAATPTGSARASRPTSPRARPTSCAASSPAAPGNGGSLDNRPVAGKTGTTDEKTDANFLGFTPQLAAFVWHGNKEARVPGAGFGGEVPASIFKGFMDAALEGCRRSRSPTWVRPATERERRSPSSGGV